MAANPDRLLAALLAAGFTTRQLASIADRALGVNLDAITQEMDPREQARALVDYATRYDLLAPLTTAMLDNGADRPALQNLLLGETPTMTTGSEGQQGSASYIMLRLESKVDQVLSEQSRQAQQMVQIAQSSADAHRRLDKMEAKPLSGMDRLIILMMVMLMVGLMAFTVYGALRP